MKWLFVLLMIALSYGQDKGYKDLPWGSPSSLMKTKYPNFRDTSFSSDPSLRDYAINPTDGPVLSRYFEFFKDRLCMVKVFYSDRNNLILPSREFSLTVVSVLGDFNKRFGNARTLSVDTVSFLKRNDVLVVIKAWQTKSADIEGRIMIDKNSFAPYSALFTYTSKKILNEYEKQLEQQKPEF